MSSSNKETVELICAADVLVRGLRRCGFCEQTYWKRLHGMSHDGSRTGTQYMCAHCGARGPFTENVHEALSAVWTEDGRLRVNRVENGFEPVVLHSSPHEHILSKGIEVLRLTSYAARQCTRHGIKSVGQLAGMSPVEILMLPRFGIGSLRNIEDRLAMNGIRLAVHR